VATAGSPGTEIRESDMLDPQAVLDQASHGRAPATWRVFTKERGRVRGFLRGTSADPDPMLVITPDGVVEYIDSKKPGAVVDFGNLVNQIAGHRKYLLRQYPGPAGCLA
jgi:hypothetical protein